RLNIACKVFLKYETVKLPACHHCAATVIGAQHLAAMSPKLTATMIDANLYPDLVEKYKIERVPMVVINEEKTLLGEKSMEDLAAILE
ncbi:MAG: thioredoxin family protein, partial [Lachnospiraceae bacterium]